MSKIRVMNELLSNKIAAGEVVEKVVSIVKELVENSVDAKSTYIKVDLKEAGLREIVVTDDGIGMEKEDALLAFQRHATSKLYTDDDLFSINSLGFRGEALPSIASVSEVVLKTCQDEVGTLVHIKGGKIIENKASESSETMPTTFESSPMLTNNYRQLMLLKTYQNLRQTNPKHLASPRTTNQLLRITNRTYNKKPPSFYLINHINIHIAQQLIYIDI